MMQTQKIIKYVALTFAIFLVVTIITGIIGAVLSIGNIFNNDNITDNLETLDVSGTASIINIDVNSVNIVLKEGTTLKAETNNKYINVKQDDNKLFITENNHNWLKNNNGDLIIYIPSDLVIDEMRLNSGAGKITIDKLSTQILYFDLGAGKVTINNLTVSKKAKINGGAGKVSILDGNINNLDLDMGVGKLSITSIITGNSKIDAGVGATELNLIGTNDDYQIKLDKGIGSSTINGNNMSDDSVYGNGTNTIDIDGGVGSIKINISDSKR